MATQLASGSAQKNFQRTGLETAIKDLNRLLQRTKKK